MATLLAIHLRPSARTPVRTVSSALAIEDTGLEGDHAVGGRRQVTLLDVNAWNDACAAIDATLDPAHRRANLVVTGVDLAQAIGKTLWVGTSCLHILGETRPCELLDDGALGLCKALRPQRRGGVYGRVITGGTIRVGDAIRVEGHGADQ